MDDKEYLKSYVEKNPDNQMAWYLLGKQYEARGEQGKARYCYIKSGEVYDAFEREPLSADEVTEAAANPLDDHKADRSRRLLRRWAVLLVVLIAFLAGDAAIRHSTDDADGRPAGIGHPAGYAETGKRLMDLFESDDDIAATGLPAVRLLPDETLLDRVLLEAVSPAAGTTDRPLLAAIARRSSDPVWIDWVQRPVFAFLASRTTPGNQASIRYLNAALCRCTPGESDAAAAATFFADWQRRQEQLLAAASAVHHYRQMAEDDPSSFSDVVRAYPNNILSGYTPLMEQALAEVLNAPESGKTGPGGMQGAPKFESGWFDVAELDPLFHEPLEIWVDPANHRLAVKSGDVILRNYPVGLGGERTPEGEFFISEKVRNPNGRSDGDFGSRGMTLSDTLYAIHGTNEPDSIGRDESLGCIRMLNEDVEELFDLVPIGTRVKIHKNTLPDEIMRSKERFQLPVMIDDTNPTKIYKWLG